MDNDNAININKSKISAIEWFVPHYTPSVPQQTKLSKQILSKTPLEVRYIESSVFMKEVNTQNPWTFKMRTQEGVVNIPIWNIVVFQQRDRQDSQSLNNDTFYRPPVTSA